MNQQQRMGTVGTDKELSDLLDFSAMFAPPLANGKNRPTTLASSQFGGAAGLDERTGSSSWGPGEQNSSTFNQGRNFGESSHYTDSEVLSSSTFLTSGLVGKSDRVTYPFNRESGIPGIGQPFLASDMAISSPDALSPSGLKAGSPFYSSYPANPRRRVADNNIDSQPKKIRKVPPGLPSSVYVSTSGEEYSRDGAGFSSAKGSTVYPGSFYMQDGMHASPDLWNTAGTIGQTGYSAMLGNAAHISQPSSFNSIHPQERMNYSLHTSEVNGSLPTSFHSGSAGYSVSNPTPPLNGTDTLLANRSSQSASSGDEIGKALASIYPADHTTNNFSSSPSTPVGSPQGIVAASQWPRPAGQTALSPNYEGGLHALQTKMDDCLEEAIHVMRTHAVGQTAGIPGSHGDIHGMLGTTSSSTHNGTVGNLAQAFSGPGITMVNRNSSLVGNHHEDSVGLPSSTTLLHSHHVSLPSQSGTLSDLNRPQESFTNLSGGITRSALPSNPSDIKREEKEEDENSIVDKSEDEKKDPKNSRNSRASQDDDDDEDLPVELKAERERERRVANNARERLRVRDINEAFKELGRMCQLHLSNDKPQTKLLILHQAVNVILNLEQQVRERNLNPKAACLKRREEEKVSGVVGDPQLQLTGTHPGLGEGHNPVSHM
ncbi:transcription factor 3b isoform X2 [Polypterus senegalus]|uniref:transcription factor 3b isoform X2 n=1 Tax=Polypterus senegalus TaxID=55291 RepID=UPI0019659B0C|nr:transcription factor 3b isoform X2 [Polypterus senegalus]